MSQISLSPDETEERAAVFARTLAPGSIVALFGDLGSGKTTWVRGMARGLGLDPSSVCSPTFTLLHLYPSIPPLYHFDLYRLPHPDAFWSAGLDEYLQQGGIACIEWAEKLEELLAQIIPRHEIRLMHHSQESRTLTHTEVLS